MVAVLNTANLPKDSRKMAVIPHFKRSFCGCSIRAGTLFIGWFHFLLCVIPFVILLVATVNNYATLDTGIDTQNKDPPSFEISTESTTYKNLPSFEISTESTTNNKELPAFEISTESTTYKNLPAFEISTESTTNKDLPAFEISKESTTSEDLSSVEISKESTTSEDLSSFEISTESTTTTTEQTTTLNYSKDNVGTTPNYTSILNEIFKNMPDPFVLDERVRNGFIQPPMITLDELRAIGYGEDDTRYKREIDNYEAFEAEIDLDYAEIDDTFAKIDDKIANMFAMYAMYAPEADYLNEGSETVPDEDDDGTPALKNYNNHFESTTVTMKDDSTTKEPTDDSESDLTKVDNYFESSTDNAMDRPNELPSVTENSTDDSESSSKKSEDNYELTTKEVIDDYDYDDLVLVAKNVDAKYLLSKQPENSLFEPTTKKVMNSFDEESSSVAPIGDLESTTNKFEDNYDSSTKKAINDEFPPPLTDAAEIDALNNFLKTRHDSSTKKSIIDYNYESTSTERPTAEADYESSSKKFENNNYYDKSITSMKDRRHYYESSTKRFIHDYESSSKRFIHDYESSTKRSIDDHESSSIESLSDDESTFEVIDMDSSNIDFDFVYVILSAFEGKGSIYTSIKLLTMFGIGANFHAILLIGAHYGYATPIVIWLTQQVFLLLLDLSFLAAMAFYSTNFYLIIIQSLRFSFGLYCILIVKSHLNNLYASVKSKSIDAV